MRKITSAVVTQNGAQRLTVNGREIDTVAYITYLPERNHYRDFAEASKTCNQEIGRVEPIWENTQKYAKIFKKYKKISQVLAELCDEE